MTEREAYERYQQQRKACREKPQCVFLRCYCLELEGDWMAARVEHPATPAEPEDASR